MKRSWLAHIVDFSAYMRLCGWRCPFIFRGNKLTAVGVLHPLRGHDNDNENFGA